MWRTCAVVVLALSVGGAGCASSFQPGVPVTGLWGGRHLEALLTESGGTLEYDCASGTISGPLLPDASGHFVAAGMHSPGHGGPVREDEVPLFLPARYEGFLAGDRLTLVVTLVDGNQAVGTFSLRRGAAGSIFRCL